MLGRSILRPSILALALAAAAPALAQDVAPPEGAPAELGDLTPGEQIQALLTQGQEQYNAGNYEAALQSFTPVVRAFEQSGAYRPEPLLLRARTYAKLEEYEPALDDLKKAFQYAQSQPALLPQIQNARAEIYMDLKAYEEAYPDLQAALEIARNDPQINFNYGKALVYLGGAQMAEKPLTKYIEAAAAAVEERAAEGESLTEEQNEQRSEAHVLLARAYAATLKYEKSREAIATALEIDPDNYDAYFTRAQINLQAEEYGAAVADIRQSIENYEPEEEEDTMPFAQGYLFLASALEEKGKELARNGDEQAADAAYAESEKAAERLIELLPEEDMRSLGVRMAALFRKGVAERLQGDLGDAVTSFSQVIEIDPNQGEAYFRRGICFHFLGEERLAVRDFEQAASINFDSPRSNLWKGMSYAKNGEYREAIRAYGESIAVSDRYTPAYVNRGLAHLSLGNYQKAIDDFNEAIRLNPTDAANYYRRGRAQALLGEREKAIRSFTNAIEFDPELRPAYSAAAEELAADGQEALAAEYRSRLATLGE
ncbi:tetratricopeptide repeat protein [Botrimarina sp.]|uniref:tetratricopeptide repeat protein n=1 Tax=Botrimarina sp. TaxID=2795802 RepID=UPI0032ECC0BB